MRPKKIILAVNSNEQELSVLTFMLSTNGYRVLPAVSGDEAAGLISENAIDLDTSSAILFRTEGEWDTPAKYE